MNGMGRTGGRISMDRQNGGSRRKRLLAKGVFLAVRLLILLFLLSSIRNLQVRQEKMQLTLNLLKISQDQVPTVGGAEAIPPAGDKSAGGGYMESIPSWPLEVPQERTPLETLQRLEELAEKSPVIEQICLNRDKYPEELLTALANNPEMAEFAAAYPEGSGEKSALTDSEKEQEFPLFLQWDPRWGYEAYGESCIGLAGCGPTCLSMAMYYLTGDETATPDRIAAYSMENGYYEKGIGTAWTLMDDLPELYGVRVAELSASEQNMRAALDQGRVIICAVGRGYFTTAGHFIVIYGYDREGFWVNDPNCVARSREKWAFSDIQYQLKKIWAYG